MTSAQLLDALIEEAHQDGALDAALDEGYPVDHVSVRKHLFRLDRLKAIVLMRLEGPTKLPKETKP